MKTSLLSCGILSILALVSGCAGDGPDANQSETDPQPEPPVGSDVDFAAQVQPIFDGHCSCHLEANAPQGLSLRPGASFDSLVGVPSAERPELARATPGNPDESYLVIKIDDAVPERDALRVGERMPRGLPALSRADIDTIRRWIAEGALREVSPSMDLDTTPPVFEGVSRVVAVSAQEVDLFWEAATDGVSAPADILYQIYFAEESGQQDFSQADAVAAAGSTTLRVGNLTPSTTYYFVVRAEDTSGNRDANDVEVAATTLPDPMTPPPAPEPTPVPANQPPAADAGGPYAAPVDELLVFSGIASSDPDDDPLAFSWDFGDGTRGVGRAAEHVYTTVGEYTASLTVSDGELISEEAAVGVTISDRDGVSRDPVMRRVCSQCHGVRILLSAEETVDLTQAGRGVAFFPPGTFRTANLRSLERWQATVARMRGRADSRAETSMNDDEQEQITRFLSENYSDGN